MFVVVFLITKTNKEQCHMIQQILVHSYNLPPIVAIMNNEICTKINLILKLISNTPEIAIRNTNIIDFKYYSSNHIIYNYSCDIQRYKSFYGKINIQV